jgi:hypothetical protein
MPRKTHSQRKSAPAAQGDLRHDAAGAAPHERTEEDIDRPDVPSDLDEFEPPAVQNAEDDSLWDVFIPDDDECDPMPDYGDFWDERHD